ncbi:serine/threonine protein kinase, partial [Thalassotalea crassostreae]
MDKHSAFKVLSLTENANKQEIELAYQQKSNDLKAKIESAATPALAKKFQTVLTKIEQAHNLITEGAITNTKKATNAASEHNILDKKNATDQQAYQTALKVIGANEDDSADAITKAFQIKKSALLDKMEAAATPALQKKFAKVLDKIEQAYQVLNQQSSDNSKTLAQQMDNLDDLFGKGKSSQPEKSQPEPTKASVSKSSSVLSQTKLADLPGLSPSDVPQVELQPGQVIANRYEVKELIGQGGMGVVYRAFDKNRGEDIAIKLLLPSLTKNERALERFLNEARVSSMLSHPNIVNVFDVQTHQHDDGDT